jgi:hypothetical protein
MKSYLQGLITGAVFVFALMVLIGASDNDNEVGRYAISSVTTAQFGRWEVLESIIETTIDRPTFSPNRFISLIIILMFPFY